MSELASDLPIATSELSAMPDWQALPPAAAQLLTISGATWGLLLGVGANFLAWPLRVKWSLLSPAASLVAGAVLLLVFVAFGGWLGFRRWQSSRWKLDDTGLHVKRGRLWRKEILVPRSRVQHLDIERGPIERHFGLATLIVHTAGTRLHALRQSGFDDADAVALRNALVPASDRHDDVL